MSLDTLKTKLEPILEFLAKQDVSNAKSLQAELNQRYPLESSDIQGLKALFAEGVEQGWLCDREGGGAKFSRVAKAGDNSANYSIDAVRLSGPGVWHRHTNGEIDLCFASAGDAPEFDGHPPGWVVFAPGSDHVPTVNGGQMDILYFLPGGALEWKRA